MKTISSDDYSQTENFQDTRKMCRMVSKESEYLMKTITTAEQFNELINGNQKVLVKFYAGWCPDCTRMNMFIDPIIEEYNQFDWYELNRDELPEIADKYDVMGIPSLLIFQNGEKLAHLHSANAKTPQQVTEFLSAQQ